MTVVDDGHADFGTFLRQARERRGVTLQELAVTTKISARVLEALERNDPRKLPGGIFSRAFVRAYASEVGLDPDATVASFVSAFPEESGADDMPSATSAVETESFAQRRRVAKVVVAILGAAAVVAVLLFAFYARFGASTRPGDPAASQSPAPETAPQAPAPTRNPLSDLSPPTVPVAPATDVAQNAAVPSSGQPEAAPPPVVAAEAGAAPVAGTPDTAARSQQGSLVVELTATEACWLSILVDGSRVPSRTLSAGERVEFRVARSITVRAGNAGALAVTLNGKPARSLGAAGEAVTTTIPAAAYETFLR